MYQYLKRMSVPIPRFTITEMERSYSGLLPKCVKIRTLELHSGRSKAMILSKRIGLYQMLQSESLRRFAELISGYKLYPNPDLQLHCYEHSDYSGPHNDHFPEIQRTRKEYVDLHISLCNDFVKEQLLVYEDEQHSTEVIEVGRGACIITYHLPFWHYTTPLQGKLSAPSKARRWLIICSYDIV